MKISTFLMSAAGFIVATTSPAGAVPVKGKLPLVRVKDRAKIQVLSGIDLPSDASIVYFQDGKMVKRSELAKGKPFCSLHLGADSDDLSAGASLPLVGGTYYQTYLSSFMLYTKLGDDETGQIYCEKPSPKNYLDKELQFSVNDFNTVFADLLEIHT